MIVGGDDLEIIKKKKKKGVDLIEIHGQNHLSTTTVLRQVNAKVKKKCYNASNEVLWKWHCHLPYLISASSRDHI